jgi:hypothetical protein
MSVRRDPTPPSVGAGAQTPCDSIVQSSPLKNPISGHVKEASVKPKDAAPMQPSGVPMADGNEHKG